MSDPTWAAIVPVKRTWIAKSRLVGVPPHRRPGLALAFARDTVRALQDCPAVTAVLVVSDDPTVRQTLPGPRVVVVPDEPDAGLNPALAYGARAARRRWRTTGVVLVSADLPALRAHELARVLDRATASHRCFVADATGLGTTVLCAGPASDPDPRFGVRSAARHRLSGAVEIDLPDIPSVRRDVDTDVDLWDALRLGVGPATTQVLG